MKTIERCPVCGNPEAECEHFSGTHDWHCPNCGDNTAIIGYPCAMCSAQDGPPALPDCVRAVVEAAIAWNLLYRVLPSREFWYGERAKLARENLSNAVNKYSDTLAAQHAVAGDEKTARA